MNTGRDPLHDSERWLPYTAWFNSLTRDDTIITFNYDTAVERISDLVKRPLPRNPGSYKADLPALIKLHGSIDWYRKEADVVQAQDAYVEDCEVAIGMPGNAKSKITETKLFENLWTRAIQAIREAAYVSIVGFSMPETDNNARIMILNSMAKGRDSIQRVNLVLGPDMGTIKAKRMLSILQPLLGGRKGRVTDVSLYAQGYLPRVADYLTYDF